MLMHKLLCVVGLLAVHVAAQQSFPALNLFFVMDKSLSIELGNTHCQSTSKMDCWALSVSLAQNITKFFEAQTGGVARSITDSSGLCVSIMTVSCTQGLPITKYLTHTGCSTSVPEIQGAFYRMSDIMTPHGGTCPSESINTISRIIQNISSIRGVSLVTHLTDTDVDYEDGELTTAAIESLEQTSGTTYKQIKVGRFWYQEKSQEIFTNLNTYNLTSEAEKVTLQKNSGIGGYTGNGGNTVSNELSDGAIAGISFSISAVFAAGLLVWKKRKVEYNQLI